MRRRGPREIIPTPGIERRQVELVLEQVMDRVFNGAGQELFRQIHGQAARTRIDVRVPGHARSSTRDGAIAMRVTLQQDSHEVFLQPR